MPRIVDKFLLCDRCGDKLITGWRLVGDDRFLCSKCYPEYELLLARHKVEIEDFFSKTDN